MATITGTGNGETLDGTIEDDIIDALGGDDTIRGSVGADTIDGGEGIDTLDYSASSEAIRTPLFNSNPLQGGDAEGDRISNIEIIIGSAFNDRLEAAGASELRGGDGNDTLISRGAVDLFGGNDDDVFGLNPNNNNRLGDATFDGGAGSDTATISTAGVEDFTDNTFISVEELRFLNLHTTLSRFTFLAEQAKEFTGIDFRSNGGSGDLVLEILMGNETNFDLTGIVTNGIATDRIEIFGDADAETITGSRIVDIISGGDGDDTIDGGDATDVAVFSGNRDAFTITANPDGTLTVSGPGQGTDTLRQIETLRFDDIDIDVTAFFASQGFIVGDDNANTLDGTDQADTIIGLAGNDTIVAGEGDDVVTGGVGADSMDGGDGFDTLDYSGSDAGVNVNLRDNAVSGGDAQGDTISGFESVIGSAFDDTLRGDGNGGLFGRDGNDTFILGAGDLTPDFDGGSGSDTVDFSAFTVTPHIIDLFNEQYDFGKNDLTAFVSNGTLTSIENYIGGGGNELIIANGAANSIDGGGAEDTVSYQFASAGVNASLSGVSTGGDATGDELVNVENLTGSQFDDTLGGNAASNALRGLDGNDTLNGGAGVDTMDGGDGDDRYFVDDAGDVVIDASGEGNDLVAANISYVLSAGAEVETLRTTANGGTTDINLTGNAFAQAIIGNAGNNVLSDGGGAADTLIGLGGDDTYIVRNKNAVIVEGAGQGENDRVAVAVDFALADDDHVEMMTTTSVNGTAGIDFVGNAFAQTIVGNAGSNIMRSGTGENDVMRGLGGDDIYRVFNAGDEIIELDGQGSDRVITVIDYVLGAGDSIELFTTDATGGTSNLNLTGNELAQTIVGNAGANRIDGKGGNDILNGLSGDDTFVFSTALDATGNVDAIRNFTSGSDTIELDLSIFSAINQAPGGLLSGFFKANAGGLATDANDRVIYDTSDGRLLYDFDGSGAGAAVQFATLTGSPGLAFSDFDVA